MKTLISFLGRGTADKSTGYRMARYDFGNGFVREVPYFGLALTEHLQPDRLVLVGTAGSMWDVFFEQQGATDDGLLALIEAVAQQRVDESMLAAHGERLAAKLGRPVDCLLIPYARDTAEQVHVLERLAGVVRPNDEVALDVTHAFRHLPMLALVAARYLTHIARVQVDSIYYGALEMTPPDGATPVLRLDGMLAMLDWVEALATYDKDGDYGVFARLLANEGMAKDNATQLQRAAFSERTSNPVKAREALGGAFQAVEQHQGALAGLFKPELKKRIAWFRGQARHDWELSLADAYLERPTICARPSFSTKLSSPALPRSASSTTTTIKRANRPGRKPGETTSRRASSNICATPSPTVSGRRMRKSPVWSMTSKLCARASWNFAAACSTDLPRQACRSVVRAPTQKTGEHIH